MPGITLPLELSNALSQYDRDGDLILNPFAAELDAKRPPATIYHYTDDRGLKGILESGKLWFTDIFDLNDPSELRHGLSIAIETLREEAEKSGDADSKRFAAQFARFDVEGGIEEAGHFFVCCFSGTRDELGQWRAYGDNGCGFAIGFDTRSLEEPFTRTAGAPIENHMTFPLTYSDAVLRGLQKQLLDKMFSLITRPHKLGGVHPAQVHAYWRDLLVTHAMHATRAVVFFKHEAYKNENEYRFLQLFPKDKPAPDVKYRSRPYALVRYRDFEWTALAKAALKEIVVGPAADVAKASQFARDCLEAFHPVGGVQITHSVIPYRVP